MTMSPRRVEGLKVNSAQDAGPGQGSDTSPESLPGVKGDQVAVFPYLVFEEFLSAVLISVGLMIWSLAINAPLLSEANPGMTENPAKAPWYFVGLQELLVYYDPWFAGVVVPTLIIVGLMAIPYLDTSRNAVGQYTFSSRRTAISHFLFGFGLWWLLIAIGQFLRGPNWQMYWPWQDWSVSQAAEEHLWSFPWWLGVPCLIGYFTFGLWYPMRRWPWLYAKLGRTRYVTVMCLLLVMYALPVKIVLRLVLRVRYVVVTPWFNI